MRRLAARARRRRRARAGPGNGASSGAASCAPRSWTENAPASKPGSARTLIGGSTMIPASPAGIALIPAAANSDRQRVARRDAAVDAKRERRMRVARGEHVLPLGGKFALARDRSTSADATSARPDRSRTASQQRIALAQETPQQRVDERLGRRTRQRRRRVHRVIDDGERRRPRVQELIDRDGDETVQRRIGDRLRRERSHQRVERAPVPQRAVGRAPGRARGGDRANRAPRARRFRARRAASIRPARAGPQRVASRCASRIRAS